MVYMIETCALMSNITDSNSRNLNFFVNIVTLIFDIEIQRQTFNFKSWG